MLINHDLLQGFYNSQYSYSPEFEQAYHIFKEEGPGDNPLRIADVFNFLESYIEASLQAPNKLHLYFKGLIEGKRGNHPYTNK